MESSLRCLSGPFICPGEVRDFLVVENPPSSSTAFTVAEAVSSVNLSKMNGSQAERSLLQVVPSARTAAVPAKQRDASLNTLRSLTGRRVRSVGDYEGTYRSLHEPSLRCERGDPPADRPARSTGPAPCRQSSKRSCTAHRALHASNRTRNGHPEPSEREERGTWAKRRGRQLEEEIRETGNRINALTSDNIDEFGESSPANVIYNSSLTCS